MMLSDLERLIAIEEIKKLKGQRIRAMDEKRWDEYESLHVPDHVSETYGGGEPAVGAKENVERLKKVLGHITSVHHAHQPEITITSADTAEGIWAMEDMLFWKQGAEDHWLHGYGYYHERYRKNADGWRFCYRKLTRLHVRTSEGAVLGELNSGDDSKAA